MKTTQICKEDVQRVATSLKMEVSDELIEQTLNQYDSYRKQYPDENWTTIVEIMLYDFTGPVLRGPFDQLGYEQTSEEE